MDEVRFVVNASPLIFLSRIDALPLLSELAREVVTPESVVTEVRAGGKRILEQIEIPSWIQVVPDLILPYTISAWDLGAGESQVLAHAARMPDSEAVVDDLQARRCAQALGIPKTGTLGVILRARKSGLIPAARPLVEALLKEQLYLSRNLVEAALADFGE